MSRADTRRKTRFDGFEEEENEAGSSGRVQRQEEIVLNGFERKSWKK